MKDKFVNYFDKYYDDVYRLVYSYTFNKSDTEDICQKSFMKLYNMLNKKDYPDEFIKQWLFRVAINESKNILKSFWNKNISSIDEHEFNLSSNNASLDIKNIVKKLPIKYRYVIFLYYFKGYSIKEISMILNKNESTIKTQLKRAKDLIRKDINDNE